MSAFSDVADAQQAEIFMLREVLEESRTALINAAAMHRLIGNHGQAVVCDKVAAKARAALSKVKG